MLVWRSEATPLVSRQAHALRSLIIRDVIFVDGFDFCIYGKSIEIFAVL